MNNHKRSYLRVVSVSVLALTLLCSAAGQSMPPSGSFGFLLNASFTNPFTNSGVGILGVMNFDGAGNVTGTYTFAMGGNNMQATQTITGNLTGTYSSSPDGTGSVTIALDFGITPTFAIVITDGGQGLQLALTSCPGGSTCDISGALVSGFARAAHAGSPNGSYGFQFNTSPAPGANMGVISFDGAGNAAVSFTNVGVANSPGGMPVNQAPVSKGTGTGTYSVNPDGSGTINFAPPPGQSAGTAFAFVIVDGGSGALVLRTSGTGSNVLLGTARLQ
jgi:hypothetical protein